ncbi:Metallo-dependent phosphatase-like protein [Gilbertella persicaria]|uniref:Metallo-dependent phosphatase-like protein n=1 Tax=Gilbertella persicaria TaxID=101096 RepID=UPI00221F9611|nr:Metallo-dependent phosphatase-like protein [Gilbertella persicaria]KAI8094944.1 Metallo-dependent phosphatase-like protein [Gilbertella persicaria]
MSPPSYAYPVSPYANLTRLKVLEVSPNSRVFIMGDVHGCLKEMNALLSQVQFEAAKDVLILTGDLVARGEDPVGVIRRAQEIGAYCVRGNHDDKAIRTKLYLDQHGLEAMSDANELIPEGSVADPLKFGNRHLDVAKALGPQEFDYLMGCPLILDIPNLNARVVHGGLDPAIPNLVDNDPWSVMNMRSIMQENNQPSKKKMKELKNTDAKHWAEVYRASPLAHNNATVYYGHDASLGVQVHGKTVGLDSGCVYGRKLTTMEVHSQKLFQVDCEARKKDEED